MVDLLINLNDFSDLRELIEVILPLHVVSKQNIKIKIIFREYNELSHLLCIIAVIQSLRKKGKKVFIYCDTNLSYLQSINFFKELEIKHTESFQRYESTGRFLEITHMTKDTANEYVNNIMRILDSKMSSSKDTIACLNYCLWELVDNIQEHANSIIGGYTAAQYCPQKNCIEIVIVDVGCGICSSLKKNPKFKNLSEKETIKCCIQKGYTRGTGQGNGLFQTTRFIQENNGIFCLYSGNYTLKIKNGKVQIDSAPQWQGTIIHVKLNSDVPVALNKIFGDNIPTSVDEYSDLINGLW